MDLLREQCGVATRRQLYQMGMTPSELKARVAAGRWRFLNQLVVATHNGSLSRAQARWAAVLSAPGLVGLCALTAFEVHRVKGFETDTVHIVVPRGHHVPEVDGVDVDVHESRRFTKLDLLPWLLPVVRVERAAVDAAVWSEDLRTATRILTAPIQQHRVSPELLRKEFDGLQNVRFRRALQLLLTDLEGGAQALSEVEFLRWCRRHGFPKPQTQVRRDSAGRRRYLDAEFDLPRETVMVEVDGGVHLRLDKRWDDTAKDNDVAIARQLTLRFPSVAIYGDDPRAIEQLRAAIAMCQR
jgi:hypothetical protein